jgi:Ser-tRNA(Ala) deacylase AlaX
LLVLNVHGSSRKLLGARIRMEIPKTRLLYYNDVYLREFEAFHENLRTHPSDVSQVRVVKVEGVHACACRGTHIKSTGGIGTVSILRRSSKGKDVDRLEFRAQNP